jgi:hypothetical protein
MLPKIDASHGVAVPEPGAVAGMHKAARAATCRRHHNREARRGSLRAQQQKPKASFLSLSQRTSSGSATPLDGVNGVHRHDIGAHEVPTQRSSNTSHRHRVIWSAELMSRPRRDRRASGRTP